MPESPRQFTHDDYTVGLICALTLTEWVATSAMLDEEHPKLPAAKGDLNQYCLGKMGGHNVVIACLPAEKQGKASAAVVAQDMLRSFKAVRFGLMVGIGGGVPLKDNMEDEGFEDEDSEDEHISDSRDIRLGDVVVSLQSKSSAAVVQYDFGKSLQGGDFVRTGELNKPPNIVLGAVAMTRMQHKLKGHKLSMHLSKMSENYPHLAEEFKYPGSNRDRAFKSAVTHKEGRRSCKACCGPLDANVIQRKPRLSTSPMVYYGTIGSADQVMKDSILRDKWAKDEGILCFEMEAAGKFLPILFVQFLLHPICQEGGTLGYTDSYDIELGFHEFVGTSYLNKALRHHMRWMISTLNIIFTF